mmetsp:Transcript_44172/g.104563  ORF Transcript_44172/g.104563 Transcript_44172/m.104563 type:complete len:272 (+) Transcript_44172:1589-2404(+)
MTLSPGRNTPCPDLGLGTVTGAVFLPLRSLQSPSGACGGGISRSIGMGLDPFRDGKGESPPPPPQRGLGGTPELKARESPGRSFTRLTMASPVPESVAGARLGDLVIQGAISSSSSSSFSSSFSSFTTEGGGEAAEGECAREKARRAVESLDTTVFNPTDACRITRVPRTGDLSHGTRKLLVIDGEGRGAIVGGVVEPESSTKLATEAREGAVPELRRAGVADSLSSARVVMEEPAEATTFVGLQTMVLSLLSQLRRGGGVSAARGDLELA